MNAIKICIIADQIYKSGGIERVLSHRINHWIKDGYEVHLITSENEGRSPYFFYDLRLVRHDLAGGFDKSISLLSSLNLKLAYRYFFKLRAAIKNINPDVIVMTNYNYDYYFLPLIAAGTHCIKEYHSSFSQKTNAIDRLKKYYTKFYDTHVFLSKEEAHLHSLHDSVVIPNPVVMSDDSPCELTKRRKVIMTAGRIVAIKGFERLLASWSAIASKYPDWRLEIYGDGEHTYIQSLQALIEHHDMAANTAIYPSSPDIISKMLDSRIYAMSSLSECFPMVLLEAMQSRMAIVAFDCPTGPRNILKNNKTGILVENHHISDFSRSLEKLMTRTDLAQTLANNGCLEVRQYDAKAVMKKWNTLIDKACFS